MDALKESVSHKRFSCYLPGPKEIYLWDRAWSGDPLRPETARGFYVTLRVTRTKSKRPSIDALVQEDVLGNSHIVFTVQHNPNNLRHRSMIYPELVGVIRHEIEHISDDGTLALSGPAQDWVVPELPNQGKIVHTINTRRKLFCPHDIDLEAWGESEKDRLDRSDNDDMYSYLTCYEEMGPLIHGFYYEAKKARLPIDQVMSIYLSRMMGRGLITYPEFQDVFEMMTRWVKKCLPAAKFTALPTYKKEARYDNASCKSNGKSQGKVAGKGLKDRGPDPRTKKQVMGKNSDRHQAPRSPKSASVKIR